LIIIGHLLQVYKAGLEARGCRLKAMYEAVQKLMWGERVCAAIDSTMLLLYLCREASIRRNGAAGAGTDVPEFPRFDADVQDWVAQVHRKLWPNTPLPRYALLVRSLADLDMEGPSFRRLVQCHLEHLANFTPPTSSACQEGMAERVVVAAMIAACESFVVPDSSDPGVKSAPCPLLCSPIYSVFHAVVLVDAGSLWVLIYQELACTLPADKREELEAWLRQYRETARTLRRLLVEVQVPCSEPVKLPPATWKASMLDIAKGMSGSGPVRRCAAAMGGAAPGSPTLVQQACLLVAAFVDAVEAACERPKRPAANVAEEKEVCGDACQSARPTKWMAVVLDATRKSYRGTPHVLEGCKEAAERAAASLQGLLCRRGDGVPPSALPWLLLPRLLLPRLLLLLL
jgi:hypothetical protein